MCPDSRSPDDVWFPHAGIEPLQANRKARQLLHIGLRVRLIRLKWQEYNYNFIVVGCCSVRPYSTISFYSHSKIVAADKVHLHFNKTNAIQMLI
jgi:hypothetical protein